MAFVANLTRADSAFERSWPPAAAARVIDQAPRDARVFASDRHGDWLLWQLPQLHGRVAFDVRYELLTRADVLALARYTSEIGNNWLAITDGYDLVRLDPRENPSHLADFLAQPGTRLVYSDDSIQIVQRP